MQQHGKDRGNFACLVANDKHRMALPLQLDDHRLKPMNHVSIALSPRVPAPQAEHVHKQSI
jgi:hypothetical protein